MTDAGRRTPDQDVFISLSQPTIVLLTVCTKNRERWLAQASVQKALEHAWKNAMAWMVGRYVLMPDHLHLFYAPVELNMRLDAWVAYWKSRFSRLNVADTGAWQRSSWHHRLRHQESYDEKWDYVCLNPVRAGLVETANDWPCRGELNVLRW
jgi:REP element-mobilizing transposase RayT